MDVKVEYAISTLWRSIGKSAKSGDIVSKIPFYLKYMLFKCGYDSALSIVSESTISKSFEDCMKNVLDNLKQEIVTNKLDIVKYMGPYHKMDTFFLLPGHKALLKGLVLSVNVDRKRQEVKKSLKMARKGSVMTGGRVGDLSAEKHLLDRSLKAFMVKNKISGAENFKIYLNADSRHGGDRRWPQAQVACPKCSKKITVYRDKRRRRWIISHLTAHIQQHYHGSFKAFGHGSDRSCGDTGNMPRSNMTVSCRSLASKDYQHQH